MKKYRSDNGTIARALSPSRTDDAVNDANRFGFHNSSEGMLMEEPSPTIHVIHTDDNPGKVARQQQQQQQQQRLVRPVPQRVIPQDAVREFYDRTQHLPFQETNEVIVDVQNWHYVYTGNNMIHPPHHHPSKLQPKSSPVSSASVSPDIGSLMETRAHAGNPSPPGMLMKRMRRSISPEMEPKMAFLQRQQQPPDDPKIFKPIAMRVVVRPKAVRPPNFIPAKIEIQERNLSPLSFQSMNSSSRYTTDYGTSTFMHGGENIIEDIPPSITSTDEWCTRKAFLTARDGILHTLAIHGGDTNAPQFEEHLQVLIQHGYSSTCSNHSNPHRNSGASASEGMWLTLTKPTFFGNLGDNEHGDPMYTLSRMSFDMFTPGDLICSLQGNFNEIEMVSNWNSPKNKNTITIPKALKEFVENPNCIVRTYNIVTAFTIEPPSEAFPKNAPNKDVTRPIRGIMTTYGYMVEDPSTDNRYSLWITGGKIEPNDNKVDVAHWKRLFEKYPPKYGMAQQAKLLAVKILMGAVLPDAMDAQTGAMEYVFHRPIGGHGLAYIDTLYCDDSLRIVRGHRGTAFVFSKLPNHK